MNVEVTGTFVMNGYHGFQNKETGTGLNDVLAQAFRKGSVVRLHVDAEYEDTVPLCHHKNKYQYECGEILDENGNCPNAENHWQPEPTEAEVTA